jgi:dihydroneopterin aldolase
MEKSLTKITIKNIEFFAYHGVKEEENSLGGKFQVDIELYYDATEAAIQDNLSSAVNYTEILYEVNEIVSNEPFKLLETVTMEILTQIADNHPEIEMLTVRVRKFNIPYKVILNYIEAEQTFVRQN